MPDPMSPFPAPADLAAPVRLAPGMRVWAADVTLGEADALAWCIATEQLCMACDGVAPACTLIEVPGWAYVVVSVQ